MHSIAVYGDVRTHIFTDRELVIYGGALMMRDLIESAVRKVDSFDDKSIRVFGYASYDPDDQRKIIGFRRVFWKSKMNLSLRDSLFESAQDSKRERLQWVSEDEKLGSQSSIRWPAVSDDFANALAPYVHPASNPFDSVAPQATTVSATAVVGSPAATPTVAKDSLNAEASSNPPSEVSATTVATRTTDSLPTAAVVPEAEFTPTRDDGPDLAAGQFHSYRRGSEYQSRLGDSLHVWCPDIVVLDDLNGDLGKHTFPLDAPVPDPVATANLIRQNEESDGTVAKWIEPVRILFERFRTSIHHKTHKKKAVPSLEPILIYSIQYRLPPKPQSGKSGEKRTGTAWDLIATDPILRRHTIVVVDVGDLRELGNLAISEGLSWESTAQDIVYALRKSTEYRYLLDFSQLVIRIGHSGAVHVYRSSEHEHHFQLYYDPLRDDGHWVREDDGIVLGMSSLFVASLVEGLIRNCNNHNERPVLQDLPSVVGAAIPKAIRACQLRMNAVGDLHDVDPDLGRSALRDTDEISSIASIVVPTQRLAPWSILNDISQARMGTIARSIVRNGIVPTLVQRCPSFDDILRFLANALARITIDCLSHIENGTDPFDLSNSISEILNACDPADQKNAKTKLIQLLLVQFQFAFEFENLNTSTENDIIRETADTLRRDIDDLDQSIASKADCGFRLATTFLQNTLTKMLRVQGESQQSIVEEITGQGSIADTAKNVWLTGRDQLLKDSGLEPADRLAAAITLCPNKDYYDLLEKLDELRRRFSLDLYHRFLETIDRDVLEPHDNPIVQAPVFQVSDQIVLVDRQEIEGVRTIKKLIERQVALVKATLEDKGQLRPLSFAVFGPAGAGKSTAVKAVLDAMEGSNRIKRLEYNMSRYSHSSELSATFDEISGECNKNLLVVVFFDEFDARFNNERWGWLKYFLSPMEDGEYGGKSVRNAIFVFAGGTSTTYEDFNLAESHPDFQSFRQAKGPDFTSRLKGHLNIVGVNQTNPSDQLYLIRRAVIIRQILERMSLEKKAANRPDSRTFNIDEDLLRALLFVPNYRNGARSIRNILTTCGLYNNRVRNSSLTTIAQLNMFADGQAFFDLLNNVSAE
jgi:hypothetical protein